jgi:hypothetical protein
VQRNIGYCRTLVAQRFRRCLLYQGSIPNKIQPVLLPGSLPIYKHTHQQLTAQHGTQRARINTRIAYILINMACLALHNNTLLKSEGSTYFGSQWSRCRHIRPGMCMCGRLHCRGQVVPCPRSSQQLRQSRRELPDKRWCLQQRTKHKVSLCLNIDPGACACTHNRWLMLKSRPNRA